MIWGRRPEPCVGGECKKCAVEQLDEALQSPAENKAADLDYQENGLGEVIGPPLCMSKMLPSKADEEQLIFISEFGGD